MEKMPYDISELAYKWKIGTITEQERIYFDKWYAGFNDQELLLAGVKFNNREQMRSVILAGLEEKIALQNKNKQPKIIRLSRWISSVAAVLLIGIGITFFADPILDLIDPIKQMQVATGSTEYKRIKLADGSILWLSPLSRVQFPEKFRQGNRKVTLSGEAFFDVVHDTNHPFVIQSGQIKTTVLGTSFNVQAFKDQPLMTVTVVSGKVGVTSQRKTAFVTANQRAVYSKANGTLISEKYQNASKYLLQRLGAFEYQGTPFAEIVTDLETQYHVKIAVSPSILNKTFYGKLAFDAPLVTTLDKLALVLEITWKQEGNTYVFKPLSTNL